jgi:hypothetical protein
VNFVVFVFAAVSLGAEELVVDLLMGEEARAGTNRDELGNRVLATLESPDPFSSPAQGKQQGPGNTEIPRSVLFASSG